MKLVKINFRIIPDVVWLIIVLLFTYFPLILGKAVMKWDIVDINYPWNYFITESLKNGILPLWDPYSQFGFPLYGDPGTWYPINWLILIFRNYDIIANHIIFLFHSFVAGYGMYKLSKYLIVSRKIALIAGICYMLSGFFIGNAQHIRWLITAAWLPFSIYFFIRLYKSPNVLLSVKFGIAMFLMLSGGYPAIVFSYIYVLIVVYIVYSFLLLKKNFKIGWFKWNFYLLLSVLIFFLAGLIVIVGAFDFAPYINRGKPLPFDEELKGVLLGSLPFKALYSFFFPFAVGHQNIEFWGQDFSVLNCYCGFLTLIVISFALYKRLVDYKSGIFIVTGIFALMLAMPQIFPFRYWFYKSLPLMDYFRFSSFFRLYAIFSFILAFANILKKIEKNVYIIEQLTNFLKIVFVIVLIYQIFLYFKLDKGLLIWIKRDFSFFREVAGIKARTFIQGMILLLLLLLLIYALKKFPDKIISIVLFFVSLDMFQSAYLNLYDTVVYKSRASVINSYCNNFGAGFPLPSGFVLNEFSEKNLQKSTFFFYRNTGELFKHVSPDAFSPYCLLNLDSVSKTKMVDIFLLQKMAFIINNTKNIDEIDSIFIVKNEKIVFKKFTPLYIELEIDSAKNGQTLVMSQSIYPYWNAYVNNFSIKIDTICHNFIGIPLKNGKNNVKLIFEAKKIKIAFWISLITWLIVTIYLFIMYIHNNKKLWVLFIMISLIFFIISLKRLALFNYESKGIHVKDFQRYINDTTFVLINSGNNIKGFENYNNENSLKFISIYLKKQLGEFQKRVKEIDKEYLCYVHNQITFYPEEEAILRYYFPELIKKIKYGRNFILVLKRGKNNLSNVNNKIFFTNFDNLSINARLDSIESFSGKYSNYIDGINIYSYTYESNAKKSKLQHVKYLKVSLKFKRKSDNTDPLIIVDISRNGKMVYYQWIPLKWFESDINQWNYASAVFPINEILKNNDIVKIYIANRNNDDKVYIDDFEIAIID